MFQDPINRTTGSIARSIKELQALKAYSFPARVTSQEKKKKHEDRVFKLLHYKCVDGIGVWGDVNGKDRGGI